MEKYQYRVVKERRKLRKKIIKLTSFIFSDKMYWVSEEEQEKLYYQLKLMQEYYKVLNERINTFIEK